MKNLDNRTTSLVYSQTDNHSCSDTHSQISSRLANICLSSSLKHSASQHISQQLANHQSNAAKSKKIRLISNFLWWHKPKRIDNLRKCLTMLLYQAKMQTKKNPLKAATQNNYPQTKHRTNCTIKKVANFLYNDSTSPICQPRIDCLSCQSHCHP